MPINSESASNNYSLHLEYDTTIYLRAPNVKVSIFIDHYFPKTKICSYGVVSRPELFWPTRPKVLSDSLDVVLLQSVPADGKVRQIRTLLFAIYRFTIQRRVRFLE